jgi:hypothetical protein
VKDNPLCTTSTTNVKSSRIIRRRVLQVQVNLNLYSFVTLFSLYCACFIVKVSKGKDPSWPSLPLLKELVFGIPQHWFGTINVPGLSGHRN